MIPDGAADALNFDEVPSLEDIADEEAIEKDDIHVGDLDLEQNGRREESENLQHSNSI